MWAAVKFLSLPVFVITITLAWLWLDGVMGWRGPRIPRAGQFVLALGAALMLWCFVLFLRVGKGSPHPFVAKTKHLVTAGPYRYVRNPMMWGVGVVLVGLALWLGSLGLWFGLAAFVLFVTLFVRLYEEPDMERRFGEEYREYCGRVPRWWPRFGNSS